MTSTYFAAKNLDGLKNFELKLFIPIIQGTLKGEVSLYE